MATPEKGPKRAATSKSTTARTAGKNPAKSTSAKSAAARRAAAKSTDSTPTKARGAASTARKAAAGTTRSAATRTARTTEKSASAPRAAARSTFASGARRAAGERHASSPLLRATVETPPTTTAAPHGPRPPATSTEAAQATSSSARVPREPERRLRVVPETPEPAAARAGSRFPVEGAVTALASALRVGAGAVGLSTDEAEEQVARTLAYLRRRATGDFEVDEFGFDADFTDSVWLPLLRPVYEKWFRVEVRGIENIPETGGALVVANHSGTIPIDGMMTQVAIHDAHPAHRHLRMLGADLVFELPFVGTNARRAGSTLATAADAERLLRRGELVGVYPEGFKGVGKPFSERYKLQRFGRGGFVSAALRTGVPIIPCSIVGAEEIYPLIGNISVLARLMGAPYFPVTPFFPLLGPLGLIPLPSKWIIAFGEPLDTGAIGPAGAEDPMLVFDLTDQIRETIQQRLYSLLMQRRSVFF